LLYFSSTDLSHLDNESFFSDATAIGQVTFDQTAIGGTAISHAAIDK